jgi:hypothetical protein
MIAAVRWLRLPILARVSQPRLPLPYSDRPSFESPGRRCHAPCSRSRPSPTRAASRERSCAPIIESTAAPHASSTCSEEGQTAERSSMVSRRGCTAGVVHALLWHRSRKAGAMSLCSSSHARSAATLGSPLTSRPWNGRSARDSPRRDRGRQRCGMTPEASAALIEEGWRRRRRRVTLCGCGVGLRSSS